ncbi:MAG: hypothetical protein IIA17_09710 [candidate division Zixibacteria bacterium]|nr:hypothetical protein [candidate division Zixibacteria bacterium]
MRRFIKLFLLLSLWVIVSLGCDNTSEVIVGPGGDSINTVINLEVFENTNAGLTNLELRCQTDSIFGCINYMIDFDLTVTSDTVALKFIKIVKPNIFQTALGPATAIVNLGTPANIAYKFPLTVNSLTLPAQLILTDSTIEITGGDSIWTDVVRPVLYRVPANTIWGEVGYNDPLLRDSALTFFDSLASLGATPDTLSTGHYGYFFIDSSSAIDSILGLGPSIGTDSVFSYIYDYTIDTTALSNLVQAYQNQAGNLVKVNINTSDGYLFRSY